MTTYRSNHGVSGKRVLFAMLVLIALFTAGGVVLVQCAQRDLGQRPASVQQSDDNSATRPASE